MRYQIVGLSYGCELAPTLAYLQVTFPEVTFTDERTLHGTFSVSYEIYVSGSFNATELDRMRTVGSSFRDGFSKGYMCGFTDKAK